MLQVNFVVYGVKPGQSEESVLGAFKEEYWAQCAKSEEEKIYGSVNVHIEQETISG